jgi:hypothetical protein
MKGGGKMLKLKNSMDFQSKRQKGTVLYFTPDVREKLESLAKLEGVSMTRVISILIKEAKYVNK